jgi:hypothetical protein
MSTRCQVKVTGKDINNADSHTLYHHCDGYPSAMLPLIASAYTNDWQAGRIGKAAAMIVSADPTGYELQQGHSLHGDIEFYYVVDVTDGNWCVCAYSVPWECDSISCMTKLCDLPVKEAAEQAEAIEKAA